MIETRDLVAEARALLAKATPAFWGLGCHGDEVIGSDGLYPDEQWVPVAGRFESEHNARFVARVCSPADGLLAQLADEVERLRRDLEPARVAAGAIHGLMVAAGSGLTGGDADDAADRAIEKVIHALNDCGHLSDTDVKDILHGVAWPNRNSP